MYDNESENETISKSDTGTYQLKPSDTLNNFYSKSSNTYFSGKKYKDAIKALHDEVCRIQNAFEKHGVTDHGEMLVLLAYQYGIVEWRKIPYGKSDEIIEWICGNEKNWHQMFAIEDMARDELHSEDVW